MNIVYLHAHDAGRWVQPYGYPVETPNLMAFAQDAVLFRKAFCCAPTCGPSRSALLTGTYPHEHGMFGLPGAQGWVVDDYQKHLVQFLNGCGYETVLAGVQHEAPHADFSCIGYRRILEAEAPAHKNLGEFYPDSIDRVERFLAERKETKDPFFLSVGIDEPHRDNFPRPEIGLYGESDRFSKTRYYDPERLDWRFTAPPPWLPDLPEVRKDMRSYCEGVRIMDDYMGRVLDALEQHGLSDTTLVILTSDHGIEFPGGKKTLSDQGLGVMLLLRGPAGSVLRGGRVVEPMVSHLDVFPTLCAVLGQAPRHKLSGKNMLPLVEGRVDSIHEEIFAEQTYHGALDALRCVRTERYKLLCRHDSAAPILRHDGPLTPMMEQVGYYERARASDELYDLYLDPMEANNLAGDPAYREVLKDLRSRLDGWMKATFDPFVSGEFPKPKLQ